MNSLQGTLFANFHVCTLKIILLLLIYKQKYKIYYFRPAKDGWLVDGWESMLKWWWEFYTGSGVYTWEQVCNIVKYVIHSLQIK